jgi:hypothetical protein
MGAKLTTPAASRLDRSYIAVQPSGAYMTFTQAYSPEMDPAAARSPTRHPREDAGAVDWTPYNTCRAADSGRSNHLQFIGSLSAGH